MPWYLFEYKGVDLEASYHFDTGEPFELIFKAKWERKREKFDKVGKYSALWSHIIMKNREHS